jgi:hypothetical protein
MVKTKRNLVFIFSFFLFVALFFAGCEKPPQESEESTQVTENENLQEEKQENDNLNLSETGSVTEYLSSETIERINPRPIELSAFEKIFPAELNFQRFYEGEGGSGHRIRIGEVTKDRSAIFIGKIGETKAVEPGDKNHIFYVQLFINQDGVTEKITQGMENHPHTFSEMILLRGPIQKGTTWLQRVYVPELERDLEIKAVITDLRDEEGGQKVVVRYAAELFGFPDNFYKEERHFVEGKGMVFYGSTQPDGKIFGYELIGMNKFIPR